MENSLETEATEKHIGVLKNGLGCTKEEMNETVLPANTGRDQLPVSTLLGVATDGSWYALNVSNNNNDGNPEAFLATAGKQQTEQTVKGYGSWNCQQCAVAVDEAVHGSMKYVETELENLTVESAGKCTGCETTQEKLEQSRGRRDDFPTKCRHNLFMPTAQVAPLSPELTATCMTAASHYGLDGAAASMTPPVNSGSNRTSINNSTDNLSYSSDNYFADELLVLQSTLSADDIENDEEAEKISLYSDDCVYAYRGVDADYEHTLGAMKNRSRFVDDETDFLEMDFEPDPLSEVECSGGVGAVDTTNSFLLQRDTCVLSPIAVEAHLQHQLCSSPIDNMMVAPLQKNVGLQSQSTLLSKNFARIAMHLDQIRSDEIPAPVVSSRRESASLATPVESSSEQVEPLAQSLPNSLLTVFGREPQEKKEIPTASPSKITGAKPKRLNTFSTSSSASSKNSSKSRTSVRSSFGAATGLCNSSSFDERSASCTDFRCNRSEDMATKIAKAAAVASSISNAASAAFNDEACLDCLEEEFLANTIGKEMQLTECPKCHRRRGIHSAIYTSDINSRNSSSLQMKSSSLSYDFNELPGDCLYPTVHKTAAIKEFLQLNRKEQQNKSFYSKSSERDNEHLTEKPSVSEHRSRRSVCENNLLKTLPTQQQKEIATISTNNIDEETMVQALEKLHVAYNIELIKSHFASNYPSSSECKKKFKSIRHFILHASKKSCNYRRLKRLIEMATRGQVTAVYKKDPNIKETEMVPVKVSDILHQWKLTENLNEIKQLDKRFQDFNVLGKIANIIRQAQQRCSTRRPLQEFIMIPQYYPSGYLTLTREC